MIYLMSQTTRFKQFRYTDTVQLTSKLLIPFIIRVKYAKFILANSILNSSFLLRLIFYYRLVSSIIRFLLTLIFCYRIIANYRPEESLLSDI